MQYYPTQTSYQIHWIYYRGGHANVKAVFCWTVKAYASFQKKWVYHGGGHANLKSPYIAICILPSGNLTLANRSHTTTVILWSIPTGSAWFQLSGMCVLLWRIWCIDLRFQQITKNRSADSGQRDAWNVIFGIPWHIFCKNVPCLKKYARFLLKPTIPDQKH